PPGARCVRRPAANAPVYPSTVRVILVRHAEAAPGDPDAERPLTDAGHRTAEELAARLAAERPGAILCSPLLRARQTATPIAEAAGLTLGVDHRLAPGA